MARGLAFRVAGEFFSQFLRTYINGLNEAVSDMALFQLGPQRIQRLLPMRLWNLAAYSMTDHDPRPALVMRDKNQQTGFGGMAVVMAQGKLFERGVMRLGAAQFQRHQPHPDGRMRRNSQCQSKQTKLKQINPFHGKIGERDQRPGTKQRQKAGPEQRKKAVDRGMARQYSEDMGLRGLCGLR